MSDQPHWSDASTICAHIYEPRIKITEKGMKKCQNQCVVCGYSDNNFPLKLARASSTPFDYVAYAAWREWADEWARIEKESQEKERQCERRAQYNRYLNSLEWAGMRDIILARASGICEVCGKNKAAHVHHLTYERFGAERPEDLQAVCIPCHSAIHERDVTAGHV